MVLGEYINNDFAPIIAQNTVQQVNELFKILPFTHFPVVENDIFKGMLSHTDISFYSNGAEEIGNIPQLLKTYFIHNKTNLIDLISLFAQNDTDIIPVVDNEQKYLGYFELDEIVRLVSKTPFLLVSASTLIVEKDKNHFTMGEISQIIESNGIEILGMFISNFGENTTQVTLRVATENTNEIIQTLRRYEYEVLNMHENEAILEQLKERSEYLQRFFDI